MEVVEREKQELKEIIENGRINLLPAERVAENIIAAGYGKTVASDIANDYEKAVNRLAELEDKIENGTLVELPFVVVDKKKKIEADCCKIALKEDWAKCLCYCDMEGFAITQDGMLILLDECGKYTYCPDNRFKVVAESELEELQEKQK